MAMKTETPRCTIDLKLFEAWTALKRRGDGQKLFELTGKSKPTINKALNYGNCTQKLADEITTFLVNRKKKENKEMGEILKDLK